MYSSSNLSSSSPSMSRYSSWLGITTSFRENVMTKEEERRVTGGEGFVILFESLTSVGGNNKENKRENVHYGFRYWNK